MTAFIPNILTSHFALRHARSMEHHGTVATVPWIHIISVERGSTAGYAVDGIYILVDTHRSGHIRSLKRREPASAAPRRRGEQAPIEYGESHYDQYAASKDVTCERTSW
jgi:hypothetical protein